MILEPICRWLAPCFSANPEEVCARLSRLLLLLIAVELITMPLTQHLWTWDGFLHGGQDFELGLFMIVVCVCLGLLRAQHGRQRISRLLAPCQCLFRALRGRQWSKVMAFRTFASAAGDPAVHRSCGNRTSPLLI
ncbi:MAG TPA: hypothetical protein VL990_04030 [Acidobacteriaceae bacterium]|nr:hypothetical protein [Acidobacteriaceae bacterium]